MSLKRPACFDFAMDFLGDPEAAELITYIESLEKKNIELKELLIFRDGGSHDSYCDVELGRNCNCGHFEVAEYFMKHDKKTRSTYY